MNVKRFTARTSREAMALVRQAFGDDAVVLSNKPCAEGVEVLAMAPEGMSQIEKVAAQAPKVSAPSRVQARPAAAAQAPAAKAGRLAERAARQVPNVDVNDDVQALAMSTLSFQDYVRERMLKRRQAELSGRTEPSLDAATTAAQQPELPPEGVASLATLRKQRAEAAMQAMAPRRPESSPPPAPARSAPPVLRDEIRVPQGTLSREMPELAQGPRATSRT